MLPELKPRVVEVSDVAAVLPNDGAWLSSSATSLTTPRTMSVSIGEMRYLALVLKDGSIEAFDLGLADRTIAS